MKARTICTGLLLLALPLASSGAAAVALSGELEAARVTFQGPTEATGTLRAIAFRAEMSSLGDHGLRIEAPRIEVTTVHSVRDLSAVVVDQETDRWSETSNHTDADLVAIEPRSGHRFWMFPLPGDEPPRVRFAFQNGELSPPQQAKVEEGHMFPLQDRSKAEASTGGALQFTSDALRSVRVVVEGSFRFSVWEWDMVVSDDADTVRYPSGDEREDVASAPMVNGVGKSHMRQVYITVHDGLLTLDPAPVAENLFFLAGEEARAGGVTRFYSVNGHLGDVQMDGTPQDVLRTDGYMRLLDFQVDERIRMRATGEVEYMQLDNEDIRFGSGVKLAPALWALGAVALAGIATGSYLLLVDNNGFDMRQLRRAMERRRYHTVLHRADRFLQDPVNAPEAATLKAIALLALGRHGRALAYLDARSAQEEPDPQTLSFLRQMARDGKAPQMVPPDDRLRTHLGVGK